MSGLKIEHRYVAVTESGMEWAPRTSPRDLLLHMAESPVGSTWADTGERYDAIALIRHEVRSVGDWTEVPDAAKHSKDDNGSTTSEGVSA